MRSITYVSSAKELLSQEALLSLLRKCRNKNAEHGVTGLLLYHAGNFMQAIEGPEEAVRKLYNIIRSDPIHHNIITLSDEPVEERNFANWEMGFVTLTDSEISAVEGFNDLFHKSADKHSLAAKASAAKTLLLSFRQHMR
jgi:hypothetical protein